jgi:hypothetical protein
VTVEPSFDGRWEETEIDVLPAVNHLKELPRSYGVPVEVTLGDAVLLSQRDDLRNYLTAAHSVMDIYAPNQLREIAPFMRPVPEYMAYVASVILTIGNHLVTDEEAAQMWYDSDDDCAPIYSKSGQPSRT